MAERHEMLAELLQAVNRGMFEHIKDVFEKYGLPGASMAVMYHVRNEPGITVSEVARRTGIAKSHVSKTIDGLVEQGFVLKQADPSDQRLIRLHTTGQAGQRFCQLQADIRQRLSTVVAEVPEEKVETLIDSLQALRAILDKGKGY